MKIAVITPYYKESTEVLQRCHDSVMAQTFGDVTHIMISDGFPNDVVDTWENTVHIKVPNHGDYGDTPRAIGGLYASNKEFEAATLLDADNWFAPNHLEVLSDLQKETGAWVVTGTRWLARPDESVMAVCTESDGDKFCDTNCYFIMRPAFGAFGSWGFKDPKYGIIGDRFFWTRIKTSVEASKRAHCSIPTTYYQTMFATHYLAHKEQPPAGSKVIARLEGHDVPSMLTFEEYRVLLKKAMEQK